MSAGGKEDVRTDVKPLVLVRVASFISTPDIPERCQGCKDHKNDKLKVSYMFGKLFFVIIV